MTASALSVFTQLQPSFYCFLLASSAGKQGCSQSSQAWPLPACLQVSFSQATAPQAVPTEPLTQGPPSEAHCSSTRPHERRLPQPSCPTTGPSPQAAAPAQGAPAGVHLRAVPPSGLILVHCRLLRGASGDLPCAVPTGCREIDLHRSQLSASTSTKYVRSVDLKRDLLVSSTEI